ncbi:MAG: carboxypeptidase regulatory-like domain-containing protein [Planctomycetes bacterium]|nr:carboxypeptidase regulatory-like domain-containing protein [Planctomycetota bacterium]MCB9905364.1 carboxypeptidase regulatory-like domain-containing protein [Planctomycetota bacterium]
MNRLLLIALGLAACALLVVGLWFAGQGNSASAADDVVLLGPGAADQPKDDAVGRLDAPRLAPRDTPTHSDSRDEVEADDDDGPEEVDPRSAVPSDVIWVEGRVVEPDGLPAGDQLYVSAKGKTFDKRTRRKTHEVKVEPDGTFRVAMAKGTRLGWLNVRSRFAYLEESYKVKPRNLDEEIVLEPVLGGVLHGDVVAPAQLAWADDPLRGARAELMLWGQGRNTSQYEDLKGGSSFEFFALPPGDFDGNFLSVRSDYLQRGTPGKTVEIKAGEVTTITIEMKAGARITGTLLDDKGKVVPDGKIELSVTFDGNEWGGWMDRQKVTADQIDLEGNFAFYGVRPGKITLTASATGYRETKLELGELVDGEQRTNVQLVIDQGRSISGLVRWPDGKPAVGALVKLEQEADDDSWAMWEAIPSVKTDDAGRFEITGLLVDGSCRVVASLRPEGDLRPENDDIETDDGPTARRRPRPHAWRARRDGVQPGNADLILTLDSGASVTGRVVDDVGEPVTRFHVTATPMDRGMSRIDWETRAGTTVLTGDGSFKLEGIQEGKWNLVAASDGHVRSEEMPFEIPHDGSELVVVCPRSAEIHGVVRDPSGELVVGATVQARRIVHSHGGEISDTQWAGNDQTNSRGEFKLENLQNGMIQLTTQSDGYASNEPLEVQLDAGQILEGVSLRLRVGARLRIDLHPALGEIEGREITVNEISGDYWKQHKTDSSGSVVIEGLNAGEYSVSLDSADLSSDDPWELRSANQYTEMVTLTSSGTARVLLGVPPENPVLVSGRVTRGGVAAGRVIVACSLRSNSGGRNHAVQTSESGEYQLSVDVAGDYTFSVGTGDGGTIDFQRTVPEGEAARFDFDLPTMSISGVITEPGGTPASGVRVALERTHSENDEEGTVYRTVYEETDDDGHYEFGTLQAGTYHLRAGSESSWRRRNRPRFAQGVVPNIVVEDGKSVSGVNLQLEEPGTITGIVYGSDGAPVEGAWIQALDESGVSLENSGMNSSDENGRFRLTGMPPGAVKLVAHESMYSSEPTEVKVYSDQTSEAELRLRKR